MMRAAETAADEDSEAMSRVLPIAAIAALSNCWVGCAPMHSYSEPRREAAVYSNDAVLVDTRPIPPPVQPGVLALGVGAETERSKVLCLYRAKDGAIFARQSYFTCPNTFAQ
jgi:hypothetical protein